jgi:hypothetical protein
MNFYGSSRNEKDASIDKKYRIKKRKKKGKISDMIK